jgi:hypothetical protein
MAEKGMNDFGVKKILFGSSGIVHVRSHKMREMVLSIITLAATVTIEKGRDTRTIT